MVKYCTSPTGTQTNDFPISHSYYIHSSPNPTIPMLGYLSVQLRPHPFEDRVIRVIDQIKRIYIRFMPPLVCVQLMPNTRIEIRSPESEVVSAPRHVAVAIDTDGCPHDECIVACDSVDGRVLRERTAFPDARGRIVQ